GHPEGARVWLRDSAENLKKLENNIWSRREMGRVLHREAEGVTRDRAVPPGRPGEDPSTVMEPEPADMAARWQRAQSYVKNQQWDKAEADWVRLIGYRPTGTFRVEWSDFFAEQQRNPGSGSSPSRAASSSLMRSSAFTASVMRWKG